MDVVLITAVWGPWHCDAFARAALPTLLARGNLPALAAAHSCRYVFFSTGESVGRLDATPAMAQLRALMPVDVTIMAPLDSIGSQMHLSAWETAVAVAREAKAAAVSVHPDVVWSDGSLNYLARVLSAGAKAVVLPNIRVISETIVPELERWPRDANGAIAIDGDAAAAMALRHLHPCAAATIPGGPHSAAATEIFWPIPGEGLLLRHASRPAIAAVPHACSLDLEFYMRDMRDASAVVNVTDCADMTMLSLAPLFKDFGLVSHAHPLRPLELGRWCAHPQNDTPLNAWYAQQSQMLALRGARDERAWSRGKHESDAFMARAGVAGEAIKLIDALRRNGCLMAARVLALALCETALDRRVRRPAVDAGAIILAPGDAAFARFGKERLAEILAPGNEQLLLDLVLSHYRPNSSVEAVELAMREVGIGIEGSFEMPRFRLFVIDRVLPFPVGCGNTDVPPTPEGAS